MMTLGTAIGTVARPSRTPRPRTFDLTVMYATTALNTVTMRPDAIAVIVRDTDGTYHTRTTHHAVGGGAVWGMFWGFLFGLLFFIPVFGMAVPCPSIASTPPTVRSRSAVSFSMSSLNIWC